MPRFVCPLCEQEIEMEEKEVLIGKAMDHMQEEHDKKISESYVKEDIEAHS